MYEGICKSLNQINYLGIIHTIKQCLKQNEIVNLNPNPNCCFTRPYIPIHIQNINRSKSGNNYVYNILTIITVYQQGKPTGTNN